MEIGILCGLCEAEVDVFPAKMHPSHNTGLPAPFLAALVTAPNPWSVTLFAEGRKQCAVPAGSATRER